MAIATKDGCYVPLLWVRNLYVECALSSFSSGFQERQREERIMSPHVPPGTSRDDEAIS